MDHASFDVVVIGAGCGAAIGRRLAAAGQRVLVLGGGRTTGSTLRNHCVKHSGAMQTSVRSARSLWQAFESMDATEQAHLHATNGIFLLREGHATESRERWREVGIPVCEHPSDDFLRRAGAARDVRSFVTPDSVMDYRGLVAEVLRQARADGAVVWPDARCVRLVPQGGPAPAVVVQTRTGEQVVRGRHCVVAAGAWAPELLATAGVDVPVDRWKTHVVRFAVALVDQITVNVGPPLLILVPFAGSTLVGDARRVPASADDDLSVDGVAVAAMLADLTHTFPGLGTSGLGPPTAYAGIKSESRSQGSRAQEPVVLDHTSHGVDGLVVVFPGKASLMFAVADDIVTRLSGGDMANRDADH